MYNMRFNEDLYIGLTVQRLNRFRIDQRVLYTGRTNYSWGTDKDTYCTVKSAKGTIISKSTANIVIKLDDYRKPYRTTSTIPYMDAVDVIPIQQYAVVTESDLVLGTKKVDTLDY